MLPVPVVHEEDREVRREVYPNSRPISKAIRREDYGGTRPFPAKPTAKINVKRSREIRVLHKCSRDHFSLKENK